MKAKTVIELEQHLSMLTREPGQTRSELHALQQRQRRGFKLAGSAGQSAAFMGADSNNNGAIQLKNCTGGVIAAAGAIDANTGFMQVYPRSEKAPFPIPNCINGSK